MSKTIMGPERFRNVLASVGLQPSDERAKDHAIAAKLWEALRRACDPDFVVRLPDDK